MSASTVAIVVTFHPDLDGLAQLITKMIDQVDAIVLVDNGDGKRVGDWLAVHPDWRTLTLIALGDNKGIAAAQNAGIAWARRREASHVLLFDHDSDPPKDLVRTLHQALEETQKRGVPVAAVGPRCIDSRSGSNRVPTSFSRFRRGRLCGCYPTDSSPYVAVDFLIASGSLIPMAAFNAIGEMTEELFIDYVDIEWGLRARQAGWHLYGVWDIVMEHALGDDRVIIRGRAIPIHSPLRHYYAIRNAVRLCCRSKLAWGWRIGIAYNGLKRFAAYCFLMPQPFRHFRFMCLGIAHGLSGRMGRYDSRGSK